MPRDMSWIVRFLHQPLVNKTFFLPKTVQFFPVAWWYSSVSGTDRTSFVVVGSPVFLRNFEKIDMIGTPVVRIPKALLCVRPTPCASRLGLRTPVSEEERPVVAIYWIDQHRWFVLLRLRRSVRKPSHSLGVLLSTRTRCGKTSRARFPIFAIHTSMAMSGQAWPLSSVSRTSGASSPFHTVDFLSTKRKTIAVERPFSNPNLFVGRYCGPECCIHHSEEPVVFSVSHVHQLTVCCTHQLSNSVGLRCLG